MQITKQNPLLGAHMSIAGGPKNAILDGESIGCTAIQIFTASNRQWSLNPIKDDEAQAFVELKKKSSIQFIMSHASYLINIGSPDKTVTQKSMHALEAELRRCKQLEIPCVAFHPGAYLTSTEASCLDRIAENLDTVLENTKETNCMVLLENTAGQGSNVGYTFEQLAIIRHKSHHKARIGICLDTCHLFVTGYDFSTQETYKALWKAFDAIIGLEHLKALHLNDSKKGLNSRVDRHEHIGKGAIGLEGFNLIMNDDHLIHIPKILETPKEKDLVDDERNLATLRGLVK